MKRGQLIGAYLLSPFAGALYMLAFLWLVNNRPPWDFRGIISILGLFVLVGYLAEGILGTPILCWFRRSGRLSLPWFLLGGLVIGIFLSIFFLIYLFQLFQGTSFTYKLMFGLFGCIAPALLSTSLFWFLGASADNKRLERTRR
jgi:hypothetical protein